jgi:hypothetical protein
MTSQRNRAALAAIRARLMPTRPVASVIHVQTGESLTDAIARAQGQPGGCVPFPLCVPAPMPFDAWTAYAREQQAGLLARTAEMAA